MINKQPLTPESNESMLYKQALSPDSDLCTVGISQLLDKVLHLEQKVEEQSSRIEELMEKLNSITIDDQDEVCACDRNARMKFLRAVSTRNMENYKSQHKIKTPPLIATCESVTHAPFRTANEAGYYVGDEVKITFDRAGNYFKKSNRKRPTEWEGQRGIVTRITQCYVTVLIKNHGIPHSIRKLNGNVQLLVPARGTENVHLPNGKQKLRNKSKFF
jgi:hypothetical protein